MAALCADRPELLANTLLVADRCDRNVLPGTARLPSLFEDDGQALGEIVQSHTQSVHGNRDSDDHHRRRAGFEVESIRHM